MKVKKDNKSEKIKSISENIDLNTGKKKLRSVKLTWGETA